MYWENCKQETSVERPVSFLWLFLVKQMEKIVSA